MRGLGSEGVRDVKVNLKKKTLRQSLLDIATVKETMDNYIESIRPNGEIRLHLDFAYKIDGQSIIIYEIRPDVIDPKDFVECPVSKTTYINSKKVWEVYRMRGDLKWYPYKPATVKTLKDFLLLIDYDQDECFWGLARE